MTKLFINGSPIHTLTSAQIVDGVLGNARHQLYDLGLKGPFIRNKAVLAAFGGTTEASTDELVLRFHEANSDQYSLAFDALRLAEALKVCLELGIVERVGRRWRLLDDRMQFVLIGPIGKRHRSLRMRGLEGPAAALAQRKFDKDQRRIERARIKKIERIKPSIVACLHKIAARAPETPLEGYFERFIVGDHRTFGAVQELIADSVDDMTQTEAVELRIHLDGIVDRMPRKPPPPAPTAEDLAILGALQL